MKITLDDHSAEVLSALDAAIARGLETCGLVAEGYAKKLCPVDTGNLRNSITHMVDEGGDAVYIGTNSEYGAYVIHKRNLAQGSIIRVAGRILGYIKMQRDNFTLRMGNAHSRISSPPCRITRSNIKKLSKVRWRINNPSALFIGGKSNEKDYSHRNHDYDCSADFVRLF